MESYIEEKKQLLRDFCIPESVIEGAAWSECKTEVAADCCAKGIISKWL